MNEQPLDLRRMLRALWKRWLLIMGLTWAGCVAGYFIGEGRPEVYVARSSVLLPASPVDEQGKQVRNINTQVAIARNGNILERAGRVVSPPLGARTMRKQIEVKALTSDILEVRAEARSGRDAALLSDAVAKEYVAEATDVASKLAGTAISGLIGQQAKVEARLQQTKADIDAATAVLNSLLPSSPERARQGAVLDSLRLEEVDAARQVASLADKIADARLQDQLTREGTRLLSPAIPPTRPSGLPPLIFTIGGALLGLLAAVLLALVFDRRDDRLRRRSDIAAVVAVPVLASLETPRKISTRRCRLMLEHWEPRPLQRWALRQALLRLGAMHDGPPSHIVVVGLPGDAAGPLLALQLAAFTASLGTRTELVVATPHPTAARVRAACHRGLGGSEVRPYLTTSSDPTHREDDQTEPLKLTVAYVVADPEGSDLSSIPPRAVTTLGVSSGFATPDALAAAALACLDAGHPLLGVFLANHDPSDPTAGEPLDLPAVPDVDRGPALLERNIPRAGVGEHDAHPGPWDPVEGEGQVGSDKVDQAAEDPVVEVVEVVEVADPFGNGHASNGHASNGHVDDGHVGDGHATNDHVDDGHVGDGHAGDGHVGSGQVGNGHVGNGHGDEQIDDRPDPGEAEDDAEQHPRHQQP